MTIIKWQDPRLTETAQRGFIAEAVAMMRRGSTDDEIAVSISAIYGGKVDDTRIQPIIDAARIQFDGLRPIEFIDVGEWDGVVPPSRPWAVRNRIPLRQPTLVSGEGGVGKTICILQLLAATVLAKDWLGAMPEPGPVIYMGAEDEADELQRRMADILKHYDATFDEIQDDFHMASYAGEDMTLGRANKMGIVEPTPLFFRLLEQGEDIRPQIIALDTSSDIFAGNENDRQQVGTFIGLMRKLAMTADAAVTINSHPSLSGISSGSGMSGSTAWHNRVRARMFLKSVKADDGSELDATLRELHFMKSNYGPPVEALKLRWDAGVFKPLMKLGNVEQAVIDHKVDAVFLELLARFTAQNRTVNDKPGRSYAPAMFEVEQEALSLRGTTKRVLEACMRRLLAADRVHLRSYGPPSKIRYCLAVGGRP